MKKNTTPNPEAITAAVGKFISAIRNGNHRPSMYSILKKSGVNSPARAHNLLVKMVEKGIIKKYEDGSYHLTQLNYEAKVIMPMLLEKPNNFGLNKCSSQELVNELRNRGYEVICTKEVRTVETL